jgi:hypothetical protein
MFSYSPGPSPGFLVTASDNVHSSPPVFHGFWPRWLASISQQEPAFLRVDPTQCGSSICHPSSRDDCREQSLYDWRFAANHFVFATSPLKLTTRHCGFENEPLQSWSLRNILSDDNMGLSLMNRLGLFQVYVSHIYHVTEIFLSALFTSHLSI